MIPYLDEAAIRAVCPMESAVSALEGAADSYEADIPLRTVIDTLARGGQALYMPGYLPKLGALGVKIVSVYPGNAARGLPTVPSQMLLQDAETGEVCCILDGDCLTRLRTGALCGVATKYLSRADAESMFLFGSGAQAEGQIAAVLAVRAVRRVVVLARDAEKTRLFCRRISENYDVDAVPSRDVRAELPEADIITTATTSPTPLFDGGLVKPGAHINAVGAYTPQTRETDDRLIARADRIYCDTLSGVLHEGGDILIPLNNGTLPRARITGGLADAVLRRSGRADGREITLFKTVGSASFDLICAKYIYDAVMSGSRPRHGKMPPL